MDVAVRGGEVVGLGALVGHLDAVAHDVKAACVQTGEQAVPVAFHILRLHAQLLGDGAGDFHVVAHQGVALVVVAPGLPGTFQCHHQLAVGLNGGQLVGSAGGSSRRSRTGSGSAAAGIGRAACQGQHTGGSHHTHQRNKGSAFHRNILSVKMFV